MVELIVSLANNNRAKIFAAGLNRAPTYVRKAQPESGYRTPAGTLRIEDVGAHNQQKLRHVLWKELKIKH